MLPLRYRGTVITSRGRSGQPANVRKYDPPPGLRGQQDERSNNTCLRFVPFDCWRLVGRVWQEIVIHSGIPCYIAPLVTGL